MRRLLKLYLHISQSEIFGGVTWRCVFLQLSVPAWTFFVVLGRHTNWNETEFHTQNEISCVGDLQDYQVNPNPNTDKTSGHRFQLIVRWVTAVVHSCCDCPVWMIVQLVLSLWGHVTLTQVRCQSIFVVVCLSSLHIVCPMFMYHHSSNVKLGRQTTWQHNLGSKLGLHFPSSCIHVTEPLPVVHYQCFINPFEELQSMFRKKIFLRIIGLLSTSCIAIYPRR